FSDRYWIEEFQVTRADLDRIAAHIRETGLARRLVRGRLRYGPETSAPAQPAWAMVSLSEPRPTADLAPLAEGAPGLFGLYLALCDRSALFENADPGKRPRWILTAPPPGSCTPRHAAYDPETYEVLCLPDEPIPPEVIGRLWNLGLLKAVVGPS
ncbi:MAG: hypothetical protein SWK90_07000, partial [Chloroflexota bacterium]|nr:hypothetical protein [Chloroflexota bacterium]